MTDATGPTDPTDPLDHFQQAVLTALHDGGSPTDVRARVTLDAPDPALAAWVGSWDLDLVSLASLLVRTWAVCDEPAG